MRTELAPYLGRKLRWRGMVDRISQGRVDAPRPMPLIMLRNVLALDHDICIAHLWTTAPQVTLCPDHNIEFNAVVMEYRRGYHLERWSDGEIEYGLSMPTQISILAGAQ